MKSITILLFSLTLPLLMPTLARASDWSRATQLGVINQAPEAKGKDPILQEIFSKVDRAKLIALLQQLSGAAPVAVNGSTYSISERYTPHGKANFRAFWLQYFAQLGIPAQELAYTTQHSVGELEGHNLEAVLPGKSADSVVVIVHYDSIGPSGDEANNPGADDDMSGMATLMETARILESYRGQLPYTVRFVAADYEEQSSPGLEGARNYAAYLKKLALAQNFKVIGAVDDEQSGWNCALDNSCGDKSDGTTIDVFSCSGDSGNYNFSALGDTLSGIVSTYGGMTANRGCMPDNSDHYAMWEIGVPAVVFSEHNPFDNPHFDNEGGDTFDKIDQNYYFKIAQVGVTFAASLAGLHSN